MTFHIAKRAGEAAADEGRCKSASNNLRSMRKSPTRVIVVNREIRWVVGTWPDVRRFFRAATTRRAVADRCGAPRKVRIRFAVAVAAFSVAALAAHHLAVRLIAEVEAFRRVATEAGGGR